MLLSCGRFLCHPFSREGSMWGLSRLGNAGIHWIQTDMNTYNMLKYIYLFTYINVFSVNYFPPLKIDIFVWFLNAFLPCQDFLPLTSDFCMLLCIFLLINNKSPALLTESRGGNLNAVFDACLTHSPPQFLCILFQKFWKKSFFLSSRSSFLFFSSLFPSFFFPQRSGHHLEGMDPPPRPRKRCSGRPCPGRTGPTGRRTRWRSPSGTRSRWRRTPARGAPHR